jgi:hypothetical protein
VELAGEACRLWLKEKARKPEDLFFFFVDVILCPPDGWINWTVFPLSREIWPFQSWRVPGNCIPGSHCLEFLAAVVLEEKADMESGR